MLIKPAPNSLFKFLLLFLFLGFCTTGCERTSQDRDDSGMTMTLAVDPDPPLFGRPCLMTITVSDASGNPVEGAHLLIKGDMTHAGMVPVIVETRDGPNGVYSVPFEWTMGGDWVVTVEASLAEGDSFQRQFELTVGIPGG